MQSITPSDRDLALQRLRRLTVGAAVGAGVALLGVSYVAASSNPGKTSSSTALNSQGSGSTASSDDSNLSNTAPDAQSQGGDDGFGFFGQPPSASSGNGGSGAVTTGGS